MSESGDVVLVTGATGYIGAHVCKAFLDGGFRVRAAGRNAAKVAGLRQALGRVRCKRLDIVPLDLLDAGSIARATEGVKYVAHVASPCYFAPETDDEIIRPAVEGTLAVLRAATAAGVKKVVLTSSVSAVAFGHQPWPPVFDERCWSQPENLPPSATRAYTVSKTLAERAAWAYHASIPAGRRFGLVSICPGIVVGAPVFTVKGEGFLSADFVTALLQGKPETPFFRLAALDPEQSKIYLVDVESVAAAHVNAVTVPAAANHRFLLLNGTYTLPQLLAPLREAFAPKGYPVSAVPAMRDSAIAPRPADHPNDWSASTKVLRVAYKPDIAPVLVAMGEALVGAGLVGMPQPHL